MPEPTIAVYPSDLTDSEWALIESMLPGPAKLGRPPRYEKRRVQRCHLPRGALGLCLALAPARSAALENRLPLLCPLAEKRALGTNPQHPARFRAPEEQ